MTITNPYVENLVQMGYDRKDCEIASKMFTKKEFPYTIHGRTYQTEEEYNEAIHEFMNGMWQSTKWHLRGIQRPPMPYNKDIRGRETNPTKLHSILSSCVRSKPKWTLLSLTARTGNLVTLLFTSTKKITPLLFVFTVTKLLSWVMTSLKSLMAVGNPTPPNLVSMLSSIASVMLPPMVSISVTLSGIWVITESSEISLTVTSLPDHLTIHYHHESRSYCYHRCPALAVYRRTNIHCWSTPKRFRVHPPQ